MNLKLVFFIAFFLPFSQFKAYDGVVDQQNHLERSIQKAFKTLDLSLDHNCVVYLGHDGTVGVAQCRQKSFSDLIDTGIFAIETHGHNCFEESYDCDKCNHLAFFDSFNFTADFIASERIQETVWLTNHLLIINKAGKTNAQLARLFGLLY